MTIDWRLRYSRKGPAIWLAHLDQMRTFERSIRRAGIPVAYSSGFNPRPQLAFALPIGVGMATEDDYVSIKIDDQQTADQIQPEIWQEKLNQFLPEGLEILESRKVIDDRKKSLMSRVAAARYRLELTGLGDTVDQFLATTKDDAWMVEKQTKLKTIQSDIRPLVYEIISNGKNQASLLVCAGSQNNLRPDLFLRFLQTSHFLTEQETLETAITRTALWFIPHSIKAADAAQDDWVRGLSI